MTAEDVNIGRMVASRYRLDGLLGRGGFGSVYRGWDTQIGRDVAVKLLDVANRARSAQQTAELRERFRREAMAAGRINHRGIVTIYDFGVPEDDGEAYLVMELLEGRDLAAELQQKGPLLPARAQQLFVPMLEGLGQGHALGIVHKDIKPQNVFLTHPGTPREAFCLVDFGVARVVHEDKLTMTGLIVGTPQYMVPEYITDTLVTPALDVYQMGLILVEAITGTPAVPSGESFVKSCNRHFTGQLAIPEELLEGEFGAMLKLALTPNPRDRLADATLFAEMFAQIDPSTIMMDSGSTMVFVRTPEPVAVPTLYPPMNPAQASAELERLERESGELTAPPVTPTAMTQPQTVPPPGLVAAEVVAPPSVPSTAPALAPAVVLEPPHSGRIVVAIVLMLAVGVVAIALGLTADSAPAPPAPTVSPVAIEVPPTPSPLEPIVDPGPVAADVGTQDAGGPEAEAPAPAPTHRPPAAARPRPAPAAATKLAKRPFEGRVFDPEPEAPTAPTAPAADAADAAPIAPAKFSPTEQAPPTKRWEPPESVAQ